MTRLQLFSDLHAGHHHVREPVLAEGVDVVVVPGDVLHGSPLEGFAYLRRLVPAPTPLVFVLGNHEFYGRCHPEVLTEATFAAAQFGVTFLEDSAAAVCGVRFVGSTLWTDYALNGEESRPAAMAAARAVMNDHRRVTWRKQPWERFTPQHALSLHRRSRAFLEDELAAPFGGPTVVVTHHCPTPASVPARYGNDPVNAAFASDLTTLVKWSGAALWLHGHTHDSFDYQVSATRVVCNPHGYGNENPAFNPALVLEV